MTYEEACKRYRKMLSALYRNAYDRDFVVQLEQRGQELWVIGLDSKNARYIDLCGTIDPADLAIIQAKGYIDADAGYLANAQLTVAVPGKKFDLFMVNIVHFDAKPDYIEPIVVHELAHLLEHIGEPPASKGNDDRNADAILRVLSPELHRLHPKIWALHLASGGRTLIEKKLTKHKTIRAFLEAAVPHYDRLGDSILARKQP